MPVSQKWKSKFKIKEHSWVFVPTEESVIYGLEVKKAIEEKWNAPPYFYHLAGGSHIKALNTHLENKYFIHLDIKDFFGSINLSRITRCLKKNLSYQKAREIARQSTVRHPDHPDRKYILPFGFVQSPIIASLCLSQSALGNHLHKLSKNKCFRVSVYMDDIIISSDSEKKLSQQLEQTKEISNRSKFTLNPTKEEGPDVKITAFNIHLSKGELEITADRLNAFREVYESSGNKHQKAGIRNYLLSVNPLQTEIL